MKSLNITIKSINSHFDIRKAISVQKKAWNRSDYSLIPPTIHYSFIHNSGCLLGAYTDENVLVGYVIGFLAMKEDKSLYHHSQQVGVHPNYRGMQIGTKLKLAQAEFVLQQGIKLITWVVDPLLSNNANLNFNNLGGIARKYEINYYGNRNDDLNKGLETDRIIVEWYLDEKIKRTIRALKEEILDNEVPISLDYSNDKLILTDDLDITKLKYVKTAIPYDLTKLKKVNLRIIKEWRIMLRNFSIKLIDNKFLIIKCERNKKEKKSYLIWHRSKEFNLHSS